MHDTIEAHVLDLLARKIRMFELVVGELDLILSEFEEHRTFEHMVQDIRVASKNEQDMQQRFERFGNRLLQARKHFQELKESGGVDLRAC